ncbi:Fic family protein [Sulfuricaulis limicola]|uniref:Fic family protein n=1 Tax=Sulfuricaulis limicola TaxID=1620215 RepID=UPI0018D58108|nr:Fic family protein [Sulfuricaulis limicola]
MIRTPEKYHAFIPAPLPPAIPYDAELALALSRADAALSELSGLGRLLPNPHLLIAPYIRREAVLSSRIEGTRASLSDILLDEMEAEVPDGDEADVREVRNYVAALEHGVKRLRTLPLSLRLVRELHARLMKGVRGDRATPGEFRRSQNWIGPRGSTPVTASYVPPPPAPMQQSLARWERFLHERDKHPDLIQCALMHEHFEAIHPFLDGNGRVGRLLITLFLIERGRLSQPLLYLSAYIEAHRQDYYDLLQRVRTHCDWTRWLLFFLTGVTETARDAIQRADDLMALREKFRGRLKDKPKAITLLDELFLNPYITVARAAKILEVSNPTARQTVSLLERTGMLKEISGRKWGQLYLAGPIMRVIEKAGE